MKNCFAVTIFSISDTSLTLYLENTNFPGQIVSFSICTTTRATTYQKTGKKITVFAKIAKRYLKTGYRTISQKRCPISKIVRILIILFPGRINEPIMHNHVIIFHVLKHRFLLNRYNEFFWKWYFNSRAY